MTLSRNDIETAATLLNIARLDEKPFEGLPEPFRPADEDDAYAVQDALHALLTAGGYGHQVGYKIGCTTPVMQTYLGIAHPCAGALFSTGFHDQSAAVSHSAFRRVGVECEIAVSMDAGLAPQEAPFTRDDVARAVGACAAAMEIVDDRFLDFRSMDTPTLIADDFFNTGCVVGTPVHDWRSLDLTSVTGTMVINGHEVGRGLGGQAMGHPFEALAWLANSLAARGRGLDKGMIVLSGSVVETHWVKRGDHVVVAIEGLGQASATFT